MTLTTSNGRGLLIASSGGHLLQLVHLASALPEASWTWITFDTPDANSLLRGRSVIYAHHPTNRNLMNLMRNLWLALKVVRQLQPRIMISTGAGVAVPFCWVGAIFGARVVYVESLARITSVSLSGRLVHPVADRFFVQWPTLVRRMRKAEYVGSLFADATLELPRFR